MLLEANGLCGSVLASDVDRAALALAKCGRYAASSTVDLPAHHQDRVLRTNVETVEVTAAVRDRVCFVHDDLLAPATRDRFHLVSCRNVLIYLERAAQLAVLRRLIQALEPDGILLLGEAEWPPSELLPSLRVVHAGRRLFQRQTDAAPPCLR
jgi:two-component system CheB/CheR fusion protein